MGHMRLGPRHQDLRQGEALRGMLAEAGIAAEMLVLPPHRPPETSRFSPALLLLLAAPEPAETLHGLRALRAGSRLPCLVLAPPVAAEVAAAWLEAGADDVLDSAAPLGLALARARAVLRRTAWNTAAEVAAPPQGWRLLPGRRLLLRPCGTEAQLTTAEYDLFRLLTETPGRAVGRDLVAQQVLRRRIDPTDRSVDNLVLRLRRKLGEDRAVKTVRGQGYMFAGFSAGSLLVG